ncbi:MAG: methyltransferase domain-containing protein [Streptosporangiales bacterium]|nr:methyltransferase domain-containing protein [Streptosporangiales bacterium]
MDKVRQVVRQELVASQLTAHVPAAPARILDVGCGQGSQTIRLARSGHQVTGLDASERMLDACRSALAGEDEATRQRVRLVTGDGHAAVETFGADAFDVVLCHGVLMYLPDPTPLLRALIGTVTPGGMLSVLARNGDALALRPALLGNWTQAKDALTAPATYVNRLGIEARADRFDDMVANLQSVGVDVEQWYGVRALTDALPDGAPPADMELILTCEELAGRTDPYRRIAALLHFIGRVGSAR